MKSENLFSDFLHYARENHFEFSNIQISRDVLYTREMSNQRMVSYVITIKSNIKRTHVEMINVLAHANGVRFIEEL